jgi:hypothetical protein
MECPHCLAKIGVEEEFVAVGFNAYWMGIMEDFSYPTHAMIDEMFMIAGKMGATVIRSHTLGGSSGHENSLFNGKGINEKAWEPIDYSFKRAEECGVKLICPLTDNYWWYNGSCCDFGANFYTDLNTRGVFYWVVDQWMNHKNQYTGRRICDSPALYLVELGNELGDDRVKPDGSKTLDPTKEWLQSTLMTVKGYGVNVLCPTDEQCGTWGEFELPFDVYSNHFYWMNTDRLAWMVQQKKPWLIGEYSSHFGEDWFKMIEGKGWGALFWSLYPTGVDHNDGYTLHWGDPELLGLSNHFRRMRGLPEVKQL